MKRETKAVDVTVEGMTLMFVFGNGQKMAFDCNQLNPNIAATAMVHGVKQKLVDAAALSRDAETGRSATVAEKEEAIRAMAERLMRGVWNERGTGTSEGSLLLRALQRAYPEKTKEALSAFVEKLDKKQQAALRSNPKVAVHIEAIRTEAGKGVDSNELLGELEG